MTESKIHRHISNDPLHGITLKNIMESLLDYYDWEDLGEMIPLRCFTHNPTMASSLKFLRKTPWARSAVEKLYLTRLAEE